MEEKKIKFTDKIFLNFNMLLLKNKVKFNQKFINQIESIKNNSNYFQDNKNKKIPKIIHQTFNSEFDKLNIYFKKCIHNVKIINPEYQYIYYDDNDIIHFIKKYYDQYILDLYLSINEQYGAAKSDFFRYLLMYKIGGVYLDIKSAANIPFNEIIKEDDEYLLSSWNEKFQESILKTGFG